MITNSSRKDETIERLTDGIAQLTSSEAWTAWLRVQARFHRYSFSNALLIALQCPEATRVTGFHTWRRLGRTVQRGESALWILAPVTRRVVSDDDPEQSTRVVTAFKPVPVFDVSQTSGDDLPEICTRLSGDDPLDAYAELVQVARSIGFTVEDHAFEDETNGDCSHRSRANPSEHPVGAGAPRENAVPRAGARLPSFGTYGSCARGARGRIGGVHRLRWARHPVGRVVVWLRRVVVRWRRRGDRRDQSCRHTYPANC